ncbi:MAG: polysaccharide biosynthesis/export family protein [Polyangiaceae bacterium]|jgi:polysaccharide export outer membrane protein
MEDFLFGRWVWLLVVSALAVACARSGRASAVNLPPPTQSTTVGPGDTFSVSILGEKDLPSEFRIQPDGTVDFPYLDRVTVAGLEPQEIEELIKKQLIERKILVNPQVTLIVKQYNSKKVSIIGAVAKPGVIPWSEGMKLIDAIWISGGLTPLADGDHVRLTRIVGPKRTVTATINVDDITDGKLSDIPLQAGDTIKISQRMF